MTNGPDGAARPPRQRVVLAHRRGTRMVHTRVEVQQQTEVGDALVRGLVRAQVGLALRLAALVFGSLAAFAVIDRFLPYLSWLVLGVLAYPAIYAVGRLFIRLAEQGERDFLGVVEPAEDR